MPRKRKGRGLDTRKGVDCSGRKRRVRNCNQQPPVNPVNPPVSPQIPELIRENSMYEEPPEALATLNFTRETETEADSEDCKIFHMCEEPGCSFTTSWDFALNHHAKTHYQKKSSSSRVSVGFDCRKKLENLLCHSWDYESFFKVNFDSHLRSHYDWTSQKILRAPKDEELLRNGATCEYCGFESASHFLHQVHINHCSSSESGPEVTTEIVEEPRIMSPKYNIPKPRYCKNEQGLYQCIFCDFLCKFEWTFRHHRKKQHAPPEAIKWISCQFCKYKSKRLAQMKYHVRAKHKGEIIPAPTPKSKPEPRKYECAYCNFRTLVRSRLRYHKLSFHTAEEDIKYHQCSQCVFKTKFQRHLKNHVLVKHTPEEAVKWLECVYCSYKAKTSDNYRRHLQSVHGPKKEIKWFDCDHCQFKCKRKSYLKVHIKRRHFEVHTSSAIFANTAPKANGNLKDICVKITGK